MFPVLAGGFLTTVPPGKSQTLRFFKTITIKINYMCPGISAETSYYFSESPGQPFNKITYLFIFGCAAFSLLPWAFSSCKEQELLFVAAYRLLIKVASLVAENRL